MTTVFEADAPRASDTMMQRRPGEADPVNYRRHRRDGGRPLVVVLMAMALLGAGCLASDTAAWAGNKNRGGESSRRSDNSDRDSNRGGQSDNGRSDSSRSDSGRSDSGRSNGGDGDAGGSSSGGGNASLRDGNGNGGDGGSSSRNGNGDGNAGGDSGRSANNRDDSGGKQSAGNSGSDSSSGRSGSRNSGSASQDPPGSVVEVIQRLKDWLQPKAPVAAAPHNDAASDAARAWKPAVNATREDTRGRGETGKSEKAAGKPEVDRQASRDRKDGDGRKRREGDLVNAEPVVPQPRDGRGAARKDKAEPAKPTTKPRVATWRTMPPPAPGDVVRGEVLISNVSAADLKALEQRGFKVMSTTPSSLLGPITTLRAPPTMNAIEAMRAVDEAAPSAEANYNFIHRPFKAQGGVAAAPPRGVTAAATGPCDAARCYGIGLVKWQPSLAACAKGLAVGMLDTGVDYGHPAFARGRLKVGDFHRDGAPAAAAWHGTGVLALLAGDPDSGTPGLIPQSEFYVADAFYADEDGQPATDTRSLVGALNWMDKFDVKVINLSLAGPRDPMMERMIQALASKGVVVLAAAGNEGPAAPPSYPAAYKEVIAVTAVDRDQRSYRYANRGSYIDVAAPGVDIWTAVPGAKAGLQSGTSFAVPFVTAAVAVMYNQSADKSKAGILSQMGLLDLGQPGPDPIYGRGLLLAPSSCRPPNQRMPAGDSDIIAEQPSLPSAAPAAQPTFAPAASTGFSFQPAGAEPSRRR